MNFLGESHHYGLASIMECQCSQCSMLFQPTISELISYSNKNHYTANIGAQLRQKATGREANHLKEQLACIQVPSLSTSTFINLEYSMGATFETSVAPIIGSVIGNTLYRSILSISVSDLFTCQIASRSDMVA